MEPLTVLASIATIVMTGALARVGEITLDGTIERFRRLIGAKSPEILEKLESAATNPDTLPEAIEVMATLIEEDDEVRAIAEQIRRENETKPYIINQMKNVGIVNQGTIHNPVFHFY